jgi:hypothetical protein
MKKISSETQLYVQLASRGDPSAFYALFHGRIRGLYLLLRSQGKEHEAACGEAAKRLGELYGRFIHSPPRWGRADKWFAARCGLKRFDAVAAEAAVAKTDIAAYERLAVGAVNKAYCERLRNDGDDGGNIVERAPLAKRIVWTAAAVFAIGFLFFSKSVLSVSFGRFGAEYKLSFPKLAEGLWDISGLVRMEDGHPAPQPSQGAEAGARP